MFNPVSSSLTTCIVWLHYIIYIGKVTNFDVGRPGNIFCIIRQNKKDNNTEKGKTIAHGLIGMNHQIQINSHACIQLAQFASLFPQWLINHTSFVHYFLYNV